MIIAIVKFGATTGHQAAVISTPTWFAAACLFFDVAFAVAIAIVWAIGLLAIIARIVWLTEACTIVALTMGRVAAPWAGAHGTIRAVESLVAVTDLGEFITNAIAAAIIGTSLLLDLTLKTNQAHWASTFTFIALTAIIVAVGRTCLVRACRTFPPNLTEASSIIATVTIFAIRADRLRAVYAPVAHITLTLSCHTVTTPVTAATVGTHLLLASLSHVSRRTITHAIDAPTVIRAISWASLQ